MEVNNDTNDPVNYEQSGGAGEILPEQARDGSPPCPRTGRLEAKEGGNNTARFVPGCPPPWRVTFVDANDPDKKATSPNIPPTGMNDKVTLNSDWTVTVAPR